MLSDKLLEKFFLENQIIRGDRKYRKTYPKIQGN